MSGTKPNATIDKATRRIEAGAYGKAVELLAEARRRHHSPRVVALIARVASIAAVPVPPEDELPAVEPAANAAVEAACAACEAAIAVAESARARGDELGLELLAAIHADPSDLAARAIYADWLMERGDVRGELITLQLLRTHTDAQRARIHQLLAKHRDAWLGDIADACTGTIWFEAGFAAGATIDNTRAASRAGSRAWSTLETIYVWSGAPVPVDVLADPAMVALAFVGGIGVDALRMLRFVTGWQIGGLGIRFQRQLSRLDHANLVETAERLALRELGFDRMRPDGLGWLWESASAKCVEHLRIEAGIHLIPDWVAALPERIAGFELAGVTRASGWIAEVTRGPSGRLSRFSIVYRGRTADETAPIAPLLAVIDGLPPATIEAFSLRLAGARIGPAELSRIAAAIARRNPRAAIAI